MLIIIHLPPCHTINSGSDPTTATTKSVLVLIPPPTPHNHSRSNPTTATMPHNHPGSDPTFATARHTISSGSDPISATTPQISSGSNHTTATTPHNQSWFWSHHATQEEWGYILHITISTALELNRALMKFKQFRMQTRYNNKECK